jgi:two-component sensor histidine kinase
MQDPNAFARGQRDDSTVLSAYAASLGSIVTELVINALKYAFPKDHPNASVLVSY